MCEGEFLPLSLFPKSRKNLVAKRRWWEIKEAVESVSIVEKHKTLLLHNWKRKLLWVEVELSGRLRMRGVIGFCVDGRLLL